MLFWSGYGLLVMVIYFATFFLLKLSFDFSTLDIPYINNQSLPSEITLFISGIIIFLIGRYLNNRSEPIIHRFIFTGDSYVGKSHTLFYIPMEYWGIAFILLPVLSNVYEIFIK